MNFLASTTELRAAGDVGPEDVTGGDLRDLEALRDELGLGALTRPGRPDEDNSHKNCLLVIGLISLRIIGSRQRRNPS